MRPAVEWRARPAPGSHLRPRAQALLRPPRARTQRTQGTAQDHVRLPGQPQRSVDAPRASRYSPTGSSGTTVNRGREIDGTEDERRAAVRADAQGVRRDARVFHGRDTAPRARGDGGRRDQAHPRPLREGRRLHGGRLRARHGPPGRLHGAVGRRGQSRFRHAGSVPRPFAGDRVHRPPRRAVPVPQRLPGSAARAPVPVGDQVARPHRLRWSRSRTCCGRRSARRRPGTPRPVHLDIAGYTGDAITPTRAGSTSSWTKRIRAFPRSAPDRIRRPCRKRQPPSRPRRGR